MLKVFEKLFLAIKSGRQAQVITIVGTPQDGAGLGQMVILYSDKEWDGSLVNEEITQGVMSGIANKQWEKPIIFEDEHFPGYKFFWDNWVNTSKAIVFGGGHISQSLVEFLALLDIEVTVIDDRPEFANPGRFPRAHTILCDSFSNVLTGKNLNIDEQTAVIIVTRGHRYDLECLRGTLATSAGYLGMIGSRRRVAGILQLLRDEGVSPSLLSRLHSPIGLPIGGTTPAEIALSIAAEVVSVFRGGSVQRMSEQRGRICGTGNT